MMFARATSAHVALSGSVARQDPWLADGLHCRFDASDIMGFAQTPAVFTWAPVDGTPPEAFTTQSSNIPWVFRRGSGLVTQAITAPPAPALSLEITRHAPVTFRLKDKRIASAEVTATGLLRVWGVIETPGGPVMIPALRSGPRLMLSGRIFDYLMIEAPDRSRVMRIEGTTQDGLFEDKVWHGIFRAGGVQHALTLDALFAKTSRLTDAERAALRADPLAATAAQQSVAMVQGGVVAAPMPPLGGPPPAPGSEAARLHQASGMEGINAALARLVTLIDGPTPQRAQTKTQQIQTTAGSDATGRIRPLHELMLACEDTFAAMALGRRMALSAPAGTTAPVLISARAIWRVEAADSAALGALAAGILPDRAALRAAVLAERLDPAPRLLERFLPSDMEGPFLPVEARILLNPNLPDQPPAPPEATPIDLPRAIEPDGETRKVALQVQLRPGAAVVLDRGTDADRERLNPLEVAARDLGNGTILPARHKPIFGMNDESEAPLGRASVTLADRSAPFDATPYRLAQNDGFGRWSAFAPVTAPPLARPAPPAPVLRLGWRGGADGSGLLDIEVAAPHDGLLAPGGLPLAKLIVSVPLAEAPHDRFEIDIGPLPATGEGQPPIARAVPLPPADVLGETRTARVTAFYIDEADTAGAEAVAKRPIPDPTPPPAPAPLPRLKPLSFPDANGVTRAELSVSRLHPAVARLRIFAAQEASLRAGLERSGKPDLQAAARAIEAEPDMAVRASLLEAVADALPDDVWADAGAATVSNNAALVSHRVNGLPRALVALRLTSVTAAGIESLQGAIAFFALPVQKPLAPPSIEVRMRDETSFALEIPRPAGPRPDEIRILRSADSDAPAMMLPAMVIPVDDGTKWPVRAMDRGETTLGAQAKLRPFNTYRWRAQARLGPRFNGAAPGPWTAHGPAARAMLAPPERPGTPKVNVAPAPLEPDGLRIDLKELAVGETTLHIASRPPNTPTLTLPVTGPEMSVTLPADPARQAVVITLSDPLGRESDPVVIEKAAFA